MKVLLISVVLLLCSLDSLAVYRKLFYHYGERTGDRFLNRGDVESVEMYLNSPISFYNNLHYTVYINTDGVLTFTPGLQGYPPYPFGVSFQETNIKLIAPFLTDLDNSDEENTGNIWYRETAENDPLHERANKEIQRLTGQHFQTSSLLIVTWEDIAMHHKQGISQLTSFQVVLANDGSSTYAIYLYDDENQSSEINVEYWPLSGFYAGDKSRYYNVPVSDVKDVYLLNRYSNVNTLGFWMWQIGMEDMGNSNIVEPTNTDISSGDGDSVQPSTHDNINPPEPDIAVVDPFDVDVFDVEANGNDCSECHPNARCIQYGQRVCCECIDNTYGNGLQCLPIEVPQRLNGKVSGRINSVEMERIDLHSYAVTNDGRSFTAVSRVPISIGYSMQALQPLGAVIGWVFAMTASKGKNGFGLTGGIFTRTADISFGSGERVTVKERFTGIDELGYMRMTAELDGTLPAIPPSTDITIEDYKETYTRLSPGRIRSSAERTLLIGEDPLEVNIDQTIEYEECIGDARQQANLIKAMRVSVTRNYVIYDRNEQILRYAMTSKVAPSTEPVYDPCLNNECHDKADCIVRGESYLCQCQTGFAGNGRFCDDIDECISGVSDCDSKANCVNQVGSFYCTCLPGYTGDGKTCKREDVSPSAGAFLLFAQGMGLYRLPLNDYEIGGRVVMKPRQIAIGVCYDCRDEFFYWTDVSNRRIYKSRYNGDDTEVVINSGLSSPEGIAIDWISRNMYWTDSGHDTIEVAYLNGLNQRVIISDGLVNPRAIAVDPVGSYLYWTDWNRDSPKIETSNLDGSERRVLVNTGLGLPNGLTLDSVNHQICWADAGEKKVECIGQTGNPDTRYVVTSEASQPFGLTNVDNQLYWTDWERDNIGTVSINGGNLGRPMQTPVGANGKLYGITAVTTCPQGSNPCAVDNGGCSHLCLALPGNQHVCKCPTDQHGNEIPCVE